MLDQKFKNIFNKVQKTSACNQKYVIILTAIYEKAKKKQFLRVFFKYLAHFVLTSTENDLYTKRCLNFVSFFCAELTKKQNNEVDNHEFLTIVMERILEWSTLDSYDIRYHCCYFLEKVLQDIGEEVQLEIRLIDHIQQVLLERLLETKTPIKLTAISALVRLQDPSNFDCPVIQAYIQACLSTSAQVRKAIVERIAPNVITLPIIKGRILDTDQAVREVAYKKCADIGPQYFRIPDKLAILQCGFFETSEKVKSVFIKYLLPKWLTAYEGNYLKFIDALRFVSLEEDFYNMSFLSRQIIEEFYSTHFIDDLIKVLPLNHEKLIDLEKLNNSVTLFWNILISILRKKDNEENLERILPDLTPFCDYIDKLVKTKWSEEMDEWKLSEYEFDLFNILEIAENYDFSDEVGRRNMYSLTKSLLANHRFSPNLSKKITEISYECSGGVESFTDDMCQVISDIREPLAAKPLTEDQRRQLDFKLAQIRVKLNILKESQSEAIAAKEFKKAQEAIEEITNLEEQYKTLQSHSDDEKVRVVKSDNETLCRCLDILANVLELSAVMTLTPALAVCKSHFLLPLIDNVNPEVHSKLLKCLSLLCIIDRETAEEYAKLICIPLVSYRVVPINHEPVLTLSVRSTMDLISMHGFRIISDDEDSKDDTTKRKLYSKSSEEDVRAGVEKLTPSSIMEIFLDMLDDERSEVRLKALASLTAMVTHGFALMPSTLSKIWLKWFNPAVEKNDRRLHAYLGMHIQQYIKYKSSGRVIKDAIIPTFTNIVRAPKTSPLVSIDVNQVVAFISAVMNINLDQDERGNLCLDIYRKISEHPGDRIVPILVKLLSRLDLKGTNNISELIEHGEMCLENISDNMSKRLLEKLLRMLNARQAKSINETNQTNEGHNSTIQDKTITSKKPTKECVVLLQRHRINETPLPSITESSLESEVENISIDSTSSSKRSKSNTENEAPEEKRPRRSSRLTKDKEEARHRTSLEGKEKNDKMKKPTQIKRRKNRHESNNIIVLEDCRIDERVLPLNFDLNNIITSSSSVKRRSSRQNHVVVSETSDSSDVDNGSIRRSSTRIRKKRIIETL